MNKLDNTDHKILKMLQEDCRLSIKQMALELRLTNTPVYERVKKLERNGIIKKYVAILDHEKISRDTIVFISVRLNSHKKMVVAKFKQEVLKLSEVMEFYYISGSYDSLLKVMVKDLHAFKVFVEDKLSLLENVNQFQSTFVISSENKTAFDFGK